MKQNILFVFAHPDDEAFGPAGTIRKLTASGHRVWVASLCRGNRPNAEYVEEARQQTFQRVCQMLGANSVIGEADDVHLDYTHAVEHISQLVQQLDIDVVYTHHRDDLHRDHKLTAEAALVACRPKADCTVKRLYMCENSVHWATGTIMQANQWVDITDYMDTKRTVLSWYDTETYEYPDARSVESMEALAVLRGTQIGACFAEAFQLVFAHDRKTA
jgi:N-acetylglucosamine malate deacetylase 1